ncbi:MAG: hypothetical protein LUG14_10695 [Synergistaceae bacterium]|nr:hypothetical protein [Synergistaceae bacterium]
MTEVKKPASGKRGFVIVTVLIFGGVLMICASLAFQAATAMFEENASVAGRSRIENATAQASALAEEWLRVNIKDIASQRKLFRHLRRAGGDPRLGYP